MTTFGEQPPVDFATVEQILDALLKSETAIEFCRAIVHSEITVTAVQGCQIFLLDNSSHLITVAGYGLTYETERPEISAWDENPLAESVRSKTFVFADSKVAPQPVIAIPLLRDSIPVGCLALILADSVKTLPIHERLIPILAKLGAYCLSTMAYPAVKTMHRETNGEDLTSRQIEILGHMAEGLVNAEIALKLMLSESTIRQETVRIYRALGVPNRTEAAKKGRALGLIKRPPPR
jgi:DNA-binding CsgD family transcriptional regulator